MSQTKEGAKQAVKVLKKKYGEDYFREIGKMGQKAYLDKPKSERKPRGFASMTPERRKELGRKGGLIKKSK